MASSVISTSRAKPRSAAFANFPPALEHRPWIPGSDGVFMAETMTWSYCRERWVATWSVETFEQPPPFPNDLGALEFRPAPHPQSGVAISATWSYVSRRWEITWEDNFKMISAPLEESAEPASTVATGRRRKLSQPVPARPHSPHRSTSGEPESKRLRIETDRQESDDLMSGVQTSTPQLASQPLSQAAVAASDNQAGQRSAEYFMPDPFDFDMFMDKQDMIADEDEEEEE